MLETPPVDCLMTELVRCKLQAVSAPMTEVKSTAVATCGSESVLPLTLKAALRAESTTRWTDGSLLISSYMCAYSMRRSLRLLFPNTSVSLSNGLELIHDSLK